MNDSSITNENYKNPRFESDLKGVDNSQRQKELDRINKDYQSQKDPIEQN